MTALLPATIPICAAQDQALLGARNSDEAIPPIFFDLTAVTFLAALKRGHGVLGEPDNVNDVKLTCFGTVHNQ